MDIHFKSESAPGRLNEDFVIASNEWCVVLDGATELEGVDSGCCHGVRWYVSRLALSLGNLLVTNSLLSLTEILGEAIESVSRLHVASCDLSNPDSPSSVVLILREREQLIDYLVLGDSAIVLDVAGQGLQVILDDRTAHLPSRTIEAVRSLRNSEGGFWVASTMPEAANHALAGSAPKSKVQSVTLLTDGAYRLVERFGWSWRKEIELVNQAGPVEAIRRLREAEASATQNRGKRHDDATIAFVRF